MANPYHHAVSSSRKWGGEPEDYLEVHAWFDRSKRSFADFRHRALYHHTEGIFDCEAHFGPTIELSTCGRCGKTESEHPWREDVNLLLPKECLDFKPKLIPTRWIGEQHVQEDLGFIPHAAQYLERISAEPWMNRSRKLSRELEKEEVAPASQS
jgi:hypothetical protein